MVVIPFASVVSEGGGSSSVTASVWVFLGSMVSCPNDSTHRRRRLLPSLLLVVVLMPFCMYRVMKVERNNKSCILFVRNLSLGKGVVRATTHSAFPGNISLWQFTKLDQGPGWLSC